MAGRKLHASMRTLLIDNYDSFTYNLYQLIGEVNRTEPVVVRNDEVDEIAQLELERFDNIVVSPGPGHPANPRDIGISAAVIRESWLPLLGVCLGHQSVVLAEDGTVDAAPAPRHGYLDRIDHDGSGLFTGMPQGFTAVRYHSLCAWRPLPRALEVTATTGDGVVMAVRHRYRPQWGVQFHPESVSSQYGTTLLANFAEATSNVRRRTDCGAAATGQPRSTRSESTSKRSPAGTGSPAGAGVEARTQPTMPSDSKYRDEGNRRWGVRQHIIERAIDTEAIFVRFYSQSRNAFWLDGEHGEPGPGRFSFLGDTHGPLAEMVSYRVDTGKVQVTSSDGTETLPDTVFDYLSRQLNQRRCPLPDVPFDFAGGYIGYFGYEMKGECGGSVVHRSPAPDAQWLFADRVIVVDHHNERTHLLALDDSTAASRQASRGWLRETAAALEPLPNQVPPRQPGLGDDTAAAVPILGRGRRRYLADIDLCLKKLRQGESYEICLTDQASVQATVGGLESYRLLRRYNPAPYAAYLRFGELEVACSSPERFLKIDRERTVESKPIKGTAQRGTDAADDRRLRDALATDAKTRAENLMIVDLLRNDLGRVCEMGSVLVPKLMAVETYSTVHQLVSTVRGRLRASMDVIDCVRACFPGGSMTGAPKLRTMELIDEMETEPRGVYSGTIGFLGLGGTADLNIVIRTAVRYGKQWRIGAGGAIVLDSDPEAEYAEMVLKAGAALRALVGSGKADYPTPGYRQPNQQPVDTGSTRTPG